MENDRFDFLEGLGSLDYFQELVLQGVAGQENHLVVAQLGNFVGVDQLLQSQGRLVVECLEYGSFVKLRAQFVAQTGQISGDESPI